MIGLRRLAGFTVAAVALVLAFGTMSASASTLSPWWSITAGERPSVLPTEGSGQIVVTAENRGDAPTAGKVTISDQLPEGLRATGILGVAGGSGGFNRGPVKCTTLKGITCTFEKFVNEKSEVVLQSLPAYEQIEIRISVEVKPGAQSGETNSASVIGGGAVASASTSHPIQVGGAARFGVEEYSLIPEQPGGQIETQAGSHPFQVTSVVTLNTQTPDTEGNPRTVALPRDVGVELPPGFIGNPTPFAQCTDAQFQKDVKVEGQSINDCPPASAIGVVTVTFNEPNVLHFTTATAPMFNMVPRAGEPARFGFKAAGLVAAFLDTSLRSGKDYGVTVSSLQIPTLQWLLSVKLTIWGVPGAAEHDSVRGWDCLYKLNGPGACRSSEASSPPPFLVMPTSCAAPFESTVQADSWPAPGKPSEVADPFTYRLPQAVDGCNHLPFSPTIKVTPDGTAGSTPTGLNVDVHVPQSTVLDSESLAESAVKGITVALPEGVVVDPASSDGLSSCSEALVGFQGFSDLQGESTATFTEGLPVPLQPSVNFCPDASKVGTVDISTPLLPPGQHVKGAVYLASQNENPFGSLIAMYIVAEDPVSGAVVKLPGEVHLTPAGQLITTFKDNPQLAFEDAELHFFGGSRAPLATPAHCGAYTTQASFTPWSENEAVQADSTFDVTSGPNGTPCPGASLPFSPSLTGGTINIQAGSFSDLSTTISREDGQQDMQSVQLHMPAGLSGILAGVKLCPEAQANDGTCPAESLIGETTVSAGIGSDPVTVKGGRVYITEKYKGSPFGLSIVNPVKAGPFDLERDTANPEQQPACDCLVVRATLDIDPHTAALTVTTDTEGPHAIPHLIDGIPVQIKNVNVTITREHFTFNPTNCHPMKITGTISSSEGATTPVSVPFQAANCAELEFAPKFTAETSGKVSRSNGARLKVKLTYPKAPFGSQANVAAVKVELPRQLPTRLTTIQKACTAAQFKANPSGCPPASVIGQAQAITPLIPVPLHGPAYFVSNGGEQFPNLIIVLQGYGVTVDLVSDTLIRHGVTSSTFKTVPDAPVTSFELDLPQGPFSALGAITNLCNQTKTTTTLMHTTIHRHGHTVHIVRKIKHTTPTPLLMPTTFTAQNGLQLKQSTKINVTGCHTNKK
jgi:hypothetical protein